MKNAFKPLALCLLVTGMIAFTPSEAKAWRLFGHEFTSISPDLDCVEDPAGGWGSYVNDTYYFLGIPWSSNTVFVPGEGPCPCC